ncbi:MAG: metallophosphoesterase [Methanomassiliicoccales archaeon]|jgi:Icc-related predicted phosphoesterase|nr:metallophosphoesterase [Methanomassiliicoccales archaeon]
MKIGAVGDLHGKKYIELLGNKPEYAGLDLLLLAGDITENNNVEEFDLVLEKLKGMTQANLVAVFGNEEYEETHAEYKKREGIIFLNDNATTLQIREVKIKIVGTTGSLDRPTWWQRTNLPDIWKKYQQRIEKVSQLLTRDDSDFLILLMHYAPTYKTLTGEKPERYPEMASEKYEAILMEKRPDFVFHAHAHKGTKRVMLRKEQRRLDEIEKELKPVPIYNVSLPLNKSITIVELQEGKHAEG